MKKLLNTFSLSGFARKTRLEKQRVINKALAVLVALSLFAMLGIVVKTLAAPGDSDDPVVTLSYIEKQLLPNIYKYIDDKIFSGRGQNTIATAENGSDVINEANNSFNESNAEIIIDKPAAPSTAEYTFSLVSLSNGDKLIAGGGTEIVLRMGSAVVIGSERGGLANVTEAVDITHGEAVPPNSLLIVPLSDGRGIAALSDVLVLVKGKYEIQ